MLPRIPFLALFTATFLIACSTPSLQYTIDKEARNHPAMQRFLAFAQRAKTIKIYDELVDEFYTTPTQQRISSSLGWAKFVYSSAFKVLNSGHCKSIQLKETARNVQIDCIGTMIVKSMFIEDREEPMHLRVMLIQQQGRWFLDKSGYVYLNSGIQPASYNRAGIKFKSEFEQ